MRSRLLAKLATGGVALVALGSAWYFFAPQSLGGSTSYVVTDGISMEPRFHAGDLALVRSQGSYRVGEIVAYHSDVFHTVVLHRIVGRAGGRYVFKGDNNNFTDFEHPKAGQLIGALWIHVPGVGAKLESLRSPALVGGLLAAATLLFTGAAFTAKRRRRRRERRVLSEEHPAVPPAPRTTPAPAPTALLAAGVALVPVIALGLLAFTRPTTATRAFAVPYEQRSAVSYRAVATPGPAYAGDLAQTGDPLFTRVVHTVGVTWEYAFRGSGARVSGTASLVASLTSTSGWRTTLPLGGPVAFRGPRVRVSALLHLPALLTLVRQVEAITSVRGTYTLTLLGRARVSGSVNGAAISTNFSSQSHFTLDPLEIQPVVAAGSQATEERPPSQFTHATSGTAGGRRVEPQSLALIVAHPSVETARRIALGGFGAVMLALAALLALLRPRPTDEAASIRARYGRFLVPVTRVWQRPDVSVIDVEDMDALVAIAAHYDRSILHESTEDGESFWVTDESGQFRYAVPAEPAPAPQRRRHEDRTPDGAPALIIDETAPTAEGPAWVPMIVTTAENGAGTDVLVKSGDQPA